MKLYQLASDEKTYGEQASWWLVVSDDLEDEIAGPFPFRWQAQNYIDGAMMMEDEAK